MKLLELKDICLLNLVFGRTFESLFAYLFRECREQLAQRLESLPDCPPRWAGQQNRQQTLNRLAADLADHQHQHYGCA